MLSHLYAAKHSLMQQIHSCTAIIDSTRFNVGDPTLLHLNRSKTEMLTALRNIECAIESAKENRTWPLVPPPAADIIDTGDEVSGD